MTAVPFNQGSRDTISSVNQKNAAFYGDAQAKNWQPGERPVPQGPEAMIASPMQASRIDRPTESIMPGEEDTSMMDGDTPMGAGQNVHNYAEPSTYDPLYRPNMGLAVSPSDKSISMAGYDKPIPSAREQTKSVAEVNAANNEYWGAHTNFAGAPVSLSPAYPKVGTEE